MSEELVLRGLRDVVDAAKYPLLLVDLYGKHRIGVLIGCLRKLQRWNLTSVITHPLFFRLELLFVFFIVLFSVMKTK